MAGPMFSIIVPTLNVAAILNACLDSIVGQACSDFEVVVVDGCSTDGTLDVAKSFTPQLGTRLIIDSGPDQNVYDAMNRGVGMATGEWLYFLGADDTLYDAETLARVATFIGEHQPSDLVYGDVLWGSTGSRYAGVFDLDRLLFERNICHQAIFYRRELFASIGPYNLRYRICADWDFNIRCFSNPALVTRYMDIVVARYSLGTGISSKFWDEEWARRLPMFVLMSGARAERDPVDARWVFRVAQSCTYFGDQVNARKFYARRVEMGGQDEEVYFSMFRIAELMANLGEPWPGIQDAYLRAWEFRPTRAEPLYEIARRYRIDQRYRLGYHFAKRAAEIPLPEDDVIEVRAEIYGWRAADEQAVCASWIAKRAEAFTLCRRVLARPDIPDEDRQRITGNRDLCAPTMIESASSYPDALVRRLVAGQRDAEVVVSLVAGRDRAGTEQTLNSFLNCCTDVLRVGRFLLVDAGLSPQDRATLQERYGFLEFGHPSPADAPGAQLAHVLPQIDGRYWLHLGAGWRFFAPEDFITRLIAVLKAEAQVFQVGINFTDAVKLTGASAADQAVHRAPDAGRYVLTEVLASGPAMFDTERLERAGGLDSTRADPIAELERRAAAAGLRTATLDEVLCIAEV
jgi:glycosyltransferase involved in cell wall biosynthesis